MPPTRLQPPAVPRDGGRPADRDAQRSRVYRAEDAWAARLDAARRGATLATVAGSRLTLPAERHFGVLAGAAAYAADLLAHPAVTAALGPLPPPRLRTRRGQRAAHWEPPGTIALPVPAHGTPWALRESVLLHELAHHAAALTHRAVRHEPPFPAVLLCLVEAALGPQAAWALRVGYGQEGVQVGAL